MNANQIAKKILSLTESGGGEWAQMQIASLGVELAECVEAAAKVVEEHPDTKRLNAIENRNIIEAIDFMGTTTHYWNVETAKGELFTTAGGDLTLRDCIDAAIDAAREGR